MMKAHEMRELGAEALGLKITESSEELMTMRLKLKARTLDNPLDYRKARREVARMKTIFQQLQRSGAAQE